MKFIVQKVPSRNIDHLRVLPNLVVVEDLAKDPMACFIDCCGIAGNEPWVRLEDDIDLCGNFLEKIETAIATVPDEVISFFTLRGIAQTVRLPGRNFCMFQCVYMPEWIAPKLIRYFHGGVWPSQADNPAHPDMDCFVADFLAKEKLHYTLWYPSLVQHRVVVSEIDRRRSRFRQSKSFQENV